MSQTVALMLERVRASYDSAGRVWRLARSMTTPEAVETLAQYAGKLDRTARELEERASALAQTVAKTRALGAEMQALAKEAQEQLHVLRGKIPGPRQPI
jgi:ABC-type transporter Mla subunit MlaD